LSLSPVCSNIVGALRVPRPARRATDTPLSQIRFLCFDRRKTDLFLMFQDMPGRPLGFRCRVLRFFFPHNHKTLSVSFRGSLNNRVLEDRISGALKEQSMGAPHHHPGSPTFSPSKSSIGTRLGLALASDHVEKNSCADRLFVAPREQTNPYPLRSGI